LVEDRVENPEKSQFKTLREISPSAQQAVSLISDRSRPSTCPIDVATRRAGVLLSCFRKGDAENPEIYVGAVASVLSSYPEAVAYRVTDPRSGLAGRSQWLPTVAEVRIACEIEMAPARSEEARNARRAHTEAVLSAPAVRSVAKARFDELSSSLDPQEDFNGKAKPFMRSAEELAKEYASRPVKLSEHAAKAFFAPKEPTNES
jgi:hypothetical protein